MVPRWRSRIAADDSGATAVEYGVMIAMLILVTIAGIHALGGASNAFWQGNVDALKKSITPSGN